MTKEMFDKKREMFFLIGENDGILSIGQVKTPYSISEIMSIEYEGVNTCPEDVYDEGLDFWNYYYEDITIKIEYDKRGDIIKAGFY